MSEIARLTEAIERLVESKQIRSKFISCQEACIILNISKTGFYNLLKSNPQIISDQNSHKKYIFSEVLKLV